MIPMNWADLLGRAVKRGAHIINLSVGTNPRGLYDFGSLALDEFACANPDVLVVVAAGNSGAALEGCGSASTPSVRRPPPRTR